eukprot:6285953-Alexandrium_andersonii.AAC.1
MHPSGASGTDFEIVAILHVQQGGVRIGAGCSPDEHWADRGLHVGHLAGKRCQLVLHIGSPHRSPCCCIKRQ